MNTPASIELHEQVVTATESGHRLYVRRKCRADLGTLDGTQTLLFVHGATYPSSVTFDLGFHGQPSWMDDLAQVGFDVYAVDLPGYGLSPLLPEMSHPPEDGSPLLVTREAVADIGTVVEEILAARNLECLCLVGWSWGATIAASYASLHPANVAKLVLHAPQWLRDAPHPISGRLGAYREVTSTSGLERWLGAIPVAERDNIVPRDWQNAWISASFTAHSIEGNEPVIKAPNGVLKDSAAYWASERPLYDPDGITAPTLIIVGEWDRDTPLSMATTLFGKLSRVSDKRLVCVGQGSHMLMLEAHRSTLFDETRLFLAST